MSDNNAFTHITFCAAPASPLDGTPVTFDHVSSLGAGTECDAFLFWPAICFQPVPLPVMHKIKSLIRAQTLVPQDLEGTELTYLAQELAVVGNLSLSDVFLHLLDISDSHEGKLYCLCDTVRLCDADHLPLFFASEEELIDAFQRMYVHHVTPWADMKAEEVQSWESRIQDDEFSEFLLVYYSFQEQE